MKIQSRCIVAFEDLLVKLLSLSLDTTRKVFTQRENYERLLADSEDRLAKVKQKVHSGERTFFDCSHIRRVTESIGCRGHSTWKSTM